MRIFKHRRFSQWAKEEKISDACLKNAISELVQGLFDTNLGGGLYKKRVATASRGKRGAYRMLIAFKLEKRAIFVFGFAKNVRSNINEREKEALKRLAKDYLNVSNEAIERLIKIREIVEVKL